MLGDVSIRCQGKGLKWDSEAKIKGIGKYREVWPMQKESKKS
jgi:hypothetical protein